MMFARGATRGRASVVGPSRTFGWLGVVLCGVLTGATPLVGWSMLGLPSLVAMPVVTLVLVLAVWRSDLARRLAWNAYGVTARSGWRVASARWAEVGSVWLAPSTAMGDRIVVQVGDRRLEGGVDRLWWLALLSSSYATRGHRLLDQIRLVRGQADRVGSDGEPPSLHRFTPLVAALACWSGGLVVALMLA